MSTCSNPASLKRAECFASTSRYDRVSESVRGISKVATANVLLGYDRVGSAVGLSRGAVYNLRSDILWPGPVKMSSYLDGSDNDSEDGPGCSLWFGPEHDSPEKLRQSRQAQSKPREGRSSAFWSLTTHDISRNECPDLKRRSTADDGQQRCGFADIASSVTQLLKPRQPQPSGPDVGRKDVQPDAACLKLLAARSKPRRRRLQASNTNTYNCIWA